jgi:hypothetical protein
MSWLIERVFEKQEINKMENVNNCLIMSLLDYKNEVPLISMIKPPLVELETIIMKRVTTV